ncbi:MAG: hypothetical protein Alis3KO_25350 [Aliiglaciecola sp.]
MFASTNLSNPFRLGADSVFRGFEPKSLLAGTTLFYFLSVLMAAAYLTLDHPSLGLRNFAQQAPTHSQYNRLPDFVPVYSTLTSDTGYTIQQISNVLAEYDLTGIETSIHCATDNCVLIMKMHNSEDSNFISEITDRLNQSKTSSTF